MVHACLTLPGPATCIPVRYDLQTLEDAGEAAEEAAGEVLPDVGDAFDGLETENRLEESLEGGVEGVAAEAVPAKSPEKKAVAGVSTLELAKDLVVENKEVSRRPRLLVVLSFSLCLTTKASRVRFEVLLRVWIGKPLGSLYRALRRRSQEGK